MYIWIKFISKMENMLFYYVLTWRCPSNLVEVLSQVCRTKISLFWRSLKWQYTYCMLIRCASLQISQEEWYLCNPVIFPFRGHKFILSLTLLYPMIYDDLIWYQNWYIVSWPLILTGQWSEKIFEKVYDVRRMPSDGKSSRSPSPLYQSDGYPHHPLLDQLKSNLVWIITRVSSLKIVSSDAVHQPTWPLLLKIEHMVKLQVFG
jgi:hypothetical protein